VLTPDRLRLRPGLFKRGPVSCLTDLGSQAVLSVFVMLFGTVAGVSRSEQGVLP